MLRFGKLEVSGGFLLAAALLFYLDTENILPWAALACALHELGHYAATRLAGGRVEAVRLTAVGGDMRLDRRRPLSYGGELFALLAGPTVNLLCASLCARLWTGEGVWLFAGLSLALGCFNLLPVYPLDGGRLLLLILTGLIPVQLAETTVWTVSALLIAILIAGGGLLLRETGSNFTLLVVAMWLSFSLMGHFTPHKQDIRHKRKRFM